MLVGSNRGGGTGTLNMVMSGWPMDGTSTDPLGKRAAVGRLGVRYALTVHAAWQPAIMAQALKAMPRGPKRAQKMRSMPVIHRHRVRPIVSPLSEEGCEGFKRPFNDNTHVPCTHLRKRFHVNVPVERPQEPCAAPLTRRRDIASTPARARH